MRTPIDLGNRRELFVDRMLIDRLSDATLVLHDPQRQPLPHSPLPVTYSTVIKDGDLYRAYYRDCVLGYDGPEPDGHPGEITCYAESRDGHEWTFPELDVTEALSPHGRNAILANASPFSHNFSPLLDTRPGVEADTRFKALAGIHSGGGLCAFGSADGIHWRKLQEAPVISSGPFAFDSQNVAFWSETEGCYVCYLRTWKTPHGELRTISRTTSKDFLQWTEITPMNPNLPGEHLYTSNTHPYVRAPHIYVALPTRFVPDRGSSTDILFMATRAGSSTYARLFTEAFIRPGLDEARWGNRSNYVALNVVLTSPTEMSIYHRSGHRYVLRLDGFVSVRAGSKPGELLTQPLIFAGNALEVNASTSAVGALQVEIQDADGAPLPGFSLAECPLTVGDSLEQRIRWRGDPDLGSLAGQPVRLRFVLTECDLYSLRFRRD